MPDRNAPWEGFASLRLVALLAAVLCAVVVTSSVRADGEAGLVVENGGQVTTYCIAYTGDGITGQELLKRAGFSVEAFGGGSGLAVCAIGDTGCKDAGSFTSCFCQCQGGDCTYWAFFTRQFGKNWVYSSLGFNLIKVKDGDVHGWKWGRGGPNNAPAPQDITFTQICGHEPRGGAAPTATTAPTAASTVPAPTTAATSNATAGATGSPAPPDQPSTTATSNPSVPTVTVTIAHATDTAGIATPQASQSGKPGSNGGGGSGAGAYLAFGAIAAVLLGGAGFGLVRRRRHGG